MLTKSYKAKEKRNISLGKASVQLPRKNWMYIRILHSALNIKCCCLIKKCFFHFKKSFFFHNIAFHIIEVNSEWDTIASLLFKHLVF